MGSKRIGHATDAAADAGTPVARRDALWALGLGTAGLAAVGTGLASAAPQREPAPATRPADGPGPSGWDERAGAYVLPPLPYAYDALEPHIDTQTMTLHHDKHHAGYVRGLNGALAALDEIRQGIRDGSETKRWSRQLAFNGSGHLLHVIFWNSMGPGGGGAPSGPLAGQIRRDFGSFERFADHFKSAAATVEGSGWGLLVFEPTARRLLVMQAEKHQNLTAWGVRPLLAIDVWEHAYYLKYQNRRKDYINAFMNVVNWQAIGQRFTALAGARGPAD